jgi:xanthine dehydrogenase YagS FAD-binding subunit
MNRFAVVQPRSFAEASSLMSDKRFKLPVLKAGGLDVIDHLKEGLSEPDVLVNIRRLRSEGSKDAVSEAGGKIRIEATATLDDIANSPIILKSAPVVASAVASAATPQVRNVATAAGNLLQRPRCWYYRAEQFHCLKKGGSACFAAEGENKYHAIFGKGPCHIVHPSNLAPALMVCGGVVHLTGGGRESLPIADLFHMPDRGILDEHNLKPGEVITHITLDAAPSSGFYAVKEKQSFDWPLAFAAVSLSLNGDTIQSAKVCAGAVAPIPWLLPEVDQALKGVSIKDDAALRTATARATEGARAMSDNAYKLRLLPVVVRRAVLAAAGRDPEASS